MFPAIFSAGALTSFNSLPSKIEMIIEFYRKISFSLVFNLPTFNGFKKVSAELLVIRHVAGGVFEVVDIPEVEL